MGVPDFLGCKISCDTGTDRKRLTPYTLSKFGVNYGRLINVPRVRADLASCICHEDGTNTQQTA